MSTTNQFDWVDFYKEFADILLTFKDNRALLVEKVKAIYQNTGISMPKLDNDFTDIDPFTVFGLFNKSSMKISNRIRIISEIKNLFNVQSKIPTSFDSIPVLNNQNATYYHFTGERANNDIDHLWLLFESALNYAKNPSKETRVAVAEYFDLVINKKGNGNSKVTMGLYWISPESFLNLDSRNEWFIYRSGRIPIATIQSLPEVEPKISADKYFSIVEAVRNYLNSPESQYKDYKELSFEAWRYSQYVNDQQKLNKEDSKGSGLGDNDVQETHYWIYSPGSNARNWDEFRHLGVMGIGWEEIGDLNRYSSRQQMIEQMKDVYESDDSFKNASLATWQFAHDIKIGDVVYAKKGQSKLVGRGIVESEYYYDPDRNDYNNLRKVKWTDVGEWDHPGQAVMKTLTDITA